MDMPENVPAYPPQIQGAAITLHGRQGKFFCAHYFQNDRLAIQVKLTENGPAWGMLTVNIPEAILEPGEILVRTWDMGADLAAAAMATGLFEDTGKRVPTGYVKASVWRIKS